MMRDSCLMGVGRDSTIVLYRVYYLNNYDLGTVLIKSRFYYCKLIVINPSLACRNDRSNTSRLNKPTRKILHFRILLSEVPSLAQDLCLDLNIVHNGCAISRTDTYIIWMVWMMGAVPKV